MNEAFLRACKPGLFTNAQISGGLIRIGTMDSVLTTSITAPDCVPSYDHFARALRAIKSPQFSLTKAGNLRVVEKEHCSVVPTSKDAPTFLSIKAPPVAIDGARFLEAVNVLRPFVTPDASKPAFFQGMHFAGGMATAYGANGCAQAWIGNGFPFTLSLPVGCVEALTAIAQPPASVGHDDHGVHFTFAGGDLELSSLLLSSEGLPDFGMCFAQFSREALQPIDPSVLTAAKSLRRSTEETALYVRAGLISTAQDHNEKGSHVSTPIAAPLAGFMVNAAAFDEMISIATHADFGGGDPWRHVYWTGKSVRGMLVTGKISK